MGLTHLAIAVETVVLDPDGNKMKRIAIVVLFVCAFSAPVYPEDLGRFVDG